MAWTRYKLEFESQSDICIGFQKLGFVQKTRYYIPAKNFWAAMTEAKVCVTVPNRTHSDYVRIGEEIDKNIRFSYFYVEENGRRLLPFAHGTIGTDEFERNYVCSTPRTAVDPSSNAAQIGALFEVEYIAAKTSTGNTRWAGDVYVRDGYDVGEIKKYLAQFSLGGERRYGMGRLRMIDAPSKCAAFADGDEDPVLSFHDGQPITAHASVENCRCRIIGEIEMLTGRITKDDRPGQEWEEAIPCWAPGSRLLSSAQFRIEQKGILTHVAACTVCGGI